MAPTPGPILAKHDNEIDIPSIRVSDGSRYRVTKDPNKNIIMKIKKNTPTSLLGGNTSQTFVAIPKPCLVALHA